MLWFSTTAPKCRRAHIHICSSSIVRVRCECVCVGYRSYHTHVATRTCTYIYRFPIQVVGGSDVTTRRFKYIAICALMCLIPIHITHFSLCHNHSLALCHNRCVAITRWRCVAIANLSSLVALCRNRQIYIFHCVAITHWRCVAETNLFLYLSKTYKTTINLLLLRKNKQNSRCLLLNIIITLYIKQ